MKQMAKSDQDSLIRKSTMAATKRRKTGKRRDGRPVRPLSAYNIFFQMERKKVMRNQSDQNSNHATGGFATLARSVSEKWKIVDAALKLELEAMANKDKQRYKHEVEEWKLAMLKEANIAMKEAIKTIPTQCHPSETDAAKVESKIPHAVTPHDIKPSPPSQSNSTGYTACLALTHSPVEISRRVQCLIGAPRLSSDEASFSMNDYTHPLGTASTEVVSNAITQNYTSISLPPPPSSCDNHVASIFRSSPEPSEAAQWDEFCVPCSSSDTRISTSNFLRPSARVSYFDYYEETHSNLSRQGQFSSELKNEDEDLLYMRGYLEGFKAARAMLGLQGV